MPHEYGKNPRVKNAASNDLDTDLEAAVALLEKNQRTRAHAKVICIATLHREHYVLEGSANLRSSDNLEQMLLVNDPATHDFHAAWIDELAARADG